MAGAVETHYLSPFTDAEPMCGGPDRGPLDLTPHAGRVSCERCRWVFGLLVSPSWPRASVWLVHRGDTVHLLGEES